MTIKQVTKWETDDGKLFDSKKEAEDYLNYNAKQAELATFLLDYDFCDRYCGFDQMAEILLTHWNMEKK